MRELVRDFLLSFFPSRARLAFRPESTHRVVAFATWGGLAQFACFSLLLWLRYRSFILGRLKEWAPYLTGTAGQIQGTAVMVSTLEFLIYPVSLLLVYFALEGLARFVTGLIGSEVLPSLPVSLAFGLIERRRQRREAERLASLPADTVEFLAEGRVRIASARSRPTWNSGITIGIRGEFCEIENKEPGMPGRPFVFVLRPAPAGKALRAYEEYDLGSATILDRKEPAPGASVGR
jgi:hypothetical protein